MNRETRARLENQGAPNLRFGVMRTLVVEDDRKIAKFVVRGLKEAGFAVDQADNGETG